MRNSLKNSFFGICLALTCLLSIFYATWQNNFVALFGSIFFLGLIVIILLCHAFHHLYVLKLIHQIHLHPLSPVEVGDLVQIKIDTRPLYLLPIFVYKLQISTQFPSRPTCHFSFGLEDVISEKKIAIDIPYRGFYKTTARISCCDIFGLFFSSVTLPGHPLFSVAPKLTNNTNNLSLITMDNSMNVVMGNVQHSGEEPFDVRKYQPGDDPRRINWRQSIRFNELFMRHQENYHTDLEDLCFVIFPPPQSDESADLFDHMIDIFLQTTLTLNPEQIRLSAYIGSQLIDPFFPTPLEMRSFLSRAYTGMIYQIPQSAFEHHGQKLVFLGAATDPVFFDAMRRYQNKTPLILVSGVPSVDEQKIENIIFLAKSLQLDVHHV